MDTYLQRLPYAYTTVQMARSPPSCLRPYRSSRWHPRTYTLFTKTIFQIFVFWALSVGPRGSTPTFSNPSPNDTHHRIFPRLSTAILTKYFTQALPTSNVTPTSTPRSDSTRRLTYPSIFSRLSTSILTILTNEFTQALPSSNVTRTPTQRTNSPRRLTYPRIFPRLSTSILKILTKDFTQALPTSNVTPTSTPRSDSPSRYLPQDFLSPLYNHLYIFLKRWSLTSNVTPTPTSDSDFTPRLTYSTIFSRHYTSILTFLEAVDLNFQRHPYTNIRFGFRSSPYLPGDFFPPLYLHFNFS